MRIICPNCTAAYEIPANAVPAQGREVQCSSCTHSWYQLPPAKDGAEPEPSLVVGAAKGDAPTEAVAPPKSPPEDDPVATEGPEIAEADASSGPTARFDALDEDAPDPASDDETGFIFANKPRRKLDPEVLEVLRAEAIFEARARQKAKTGILETQPDLGLPAPARPRPGVGKDSIRDRLARLQEAEKNPRARTWEAGEETVEPSSDIRPKAEPRTVSRPATAVATPSGKDTPKDPVRQTSEDQRPRTPQPPADERAPDTPPQDASPRDTSPHVRGLRRSPPVGSERTEPMADRPSDPQPAGTDPSAAPSTRRDLQRVTPAGLPVRLSPNELALIVEQQQRRGFRWGFGLTCGVACMAVALYLFAPTILQSLPVGGPILEQIISRGEGVQSALADMVRHLLGGTTAPPG